MLGAKKFWPLLAYAVGGFGLDELSFELAQFEARRFQFKPARLDPLRRQRLRFWTRALSGDKKRNQFWQCLARIVDRTLPDLGLRSVRFHASRAARASREDCGLRRP